MYYFLNIESFSLVPITPWAYCSNYSPTPWAYFSNYSHVLLAAPPLKYCCWRSPLMHPEFFMISCTRQVGFSQRECIVQVFTAHVLGKTIQSKSNPRYIHAPVSGSAAYLQSVGVCVCISVCQHEPASRWCHDAADHQNRFFHYLRAFVILDCALMEHICEFFRAQRDSKVRETYWLPKMQWLKPLLLCFKCNMY